MTAPAPLCDTLALIGFGLIGSSIAHAVRARGLARRIQACTVEEGAAAGILAAGLADQVTADPAQTVAGAEIVVLCVPMGAMAPVTRSLSATLAPGAILTDVGSVKLPVLEQLAPLLPAGTHLVPGHPIAGSERSGWQAGFGTLFQDRWAILTPAEGTDPGAIARVRALWEGLGSRVDEMDARHHDRVLAITSHLPHLIAYTIVGTASDLQDEEKAEVIKYSASGFRDFTRIAASDPVMWRDVFLTNREAVLEILQRFTEDLTALQRAIRKGEGQMLHDRFAATRDIRRTLMTIEPVVQRGPDETNPESH